MKIIQIAVSGDLGAIYGLGDDGVLYMHQHGNEETVESCPLVPEFLREKYTGFRVRLSGWVPLPSDLSTVELTRKVNLTPKERAALPVGVTQREATDEEKAAFRKAYLGPDHLV